MSAMFKKPKTPAQPTPEQAVAEENKKAEEAAEEQRKLQAQRGGFTDLTYAGTGALGVSDNAY